MNYLESITLMFFKYNNQNSMNHWHEKEGKHSNAYLEIIRYATVIIIHE